MEYNTKHEHQTFNETFKIVIEMLLFFFHRRNRDHIYHKNAYYIYFKLENGKSTLTAWKTSIAGCPKSPF